MNTRITACYIPLLLSCGISCTFPVSNATSDSNDRHNDSSTDSESETGERDTTDTSSLDTFFGIDTGTDTLSPTDSGTITGTDADTEAHDTDSTPTDTDDPFRPPFIIGADISFVQEREDQGYRFFDNNTEYDILELLSNNGFNYIRLRLFHDPGHPNGYQFEYTTRSQPYCDLTHTLAMAQRVKAAGMGLLLNFHYSDTWADPASQHKPAAWIHLSFPELVTALYDYTYATLYAFKAVNALPDMVQIGNEITPGMLHPDGHTYAPNNWDQLAQLLTAGLNAARDVDSNIQTMLHLDRGADYNTTRWWLDEALRRGVEFNILGQSAYTAYHGPISDWQVAFDALADNQDYSHLQFLIVEYADSYREANDLMFHLNRGLGTFMWEPTADGQWGQGLFDANGSTRRFTPRDTLYRYHQMALDYGLR